MTMNEQMRKNIEGYADQIITLEDFVAGVRQNIGMYIGAKGYRGFINMIREILQNALDEVNKPTSPATTVWITFYEGSLRVIVQDNGRGIPFNNIIRVFENEHTGSNYKKKKGEYSSGMHGVGAKVTNALSKMFTVDSYIFGEHRRVDFIDGHPVTDEYDDGTEIPKNAQGTRITFEPSLEVLGQFEIHFQDVLNLVRLLLPITKIGTIINFKGIDINGQVYEETLVNKDGLLTNLIMKTANPLIQPIEIYHDTGEMKIEAIFTYDSDNLGMYNLTHFANFCPTSGGKHEKGFVDGVTKFFRNYMNKVYLANSKSKNKLNIIGQDIMTGLVGILHVCHLQPIFSGQAKDELSNEDMYPFVRDTVCDALEKWSAANGRDLQKLCKYFKDIAEVRVNADKEKIKLSSKFNSSSITGLPKDYKGPKSGKGLELFIVEGKSAKGSTVNSRDDNQGIFPIRGKTPNPFTTIPTKFLNNEEMKSIFHLIGCGIGKQCDPSKSRFEKIIITADRDPDGDHIAANLSSAFAIYMSPLVEAGMLFKAIPPLYSIRLGKKEKFFSSRIDYIEYMQELFSKKNELKINGKLYSGKDISEMAYQNVDYISDLHHMSRNTGIEPRLLEKIIRYIDLPFDEMQSRLQNLYGWTMKVFDAGNYMKITGEVNDEFQTAILTDRFYQEAKVIKNKYLYNLNETYELNGQKIEWLYDILKQFDTSSDNVKITRYKGLGELDPDELADTTLSVENRTLIRYTMDSIKEDVEKLRRYDSNKKKMIEGSVATRSDLLG